MSSLLVQSLGWKLVDSRIRHDFPNVARLSTQELSNWLNDSKREKPLLLDVRTKVEYEVSHLEEAHRMEPGAEVKTITLAKSKPMVTYCSVGYRSAAMARKLQEAGYTQVTNLEGSIFQWANENRPLLHNGEATDKVHPFNRWWGQLLDKSHWAENPSLIN